MWPRLHLFEWNDQPWLPEVLRRGETEYLHAVISVAKAFTPLAPRIAGLLEASGADEIVDLGSGGAGPWLHLAPVVAQAAGREVTVRLTDLFPNREAFARAEELSDGTVRGEPEPVDARAVPAQLTGVRTMFDIMHHLRPDDARAVLADAARNRAPIVVAEATRRSVTGLLGMLLVPLFVLLITPMVRPFRWSRLLFTYLIPILPLLILWDGLVSCLRTYRPAELEAFGREVDASYRWEAGTMRDKGAVVTYLIGTPG